MNQAGLRRARLAPSLALVLACGSQTASPSAPAAGAGAAGKSATAQAGSASTPNGGEGGAAGSGTAGTGGMALAGAAGASEAGAGGSDASACSTAALEGLTVFAERGWDPLGYPPYAFDGCTLVYVAAAEGAGNGGLHLRDLATGEDQLLQAAEQHPRRPAVAGSVVAWESDGDNGSQVHVRYSGGADLLEKTFTLAGEPRATTDAVVFTSFESSAMNANTDVQLFEVTTQQLIPIATGAGQQRFADVSATHVAVTDFSEDPQGYFGVSGSIADIVVIERATLERTVRAAAGKQAFPLLGEDGVLAYLAWGAVHPEPKFSQFRLMAGQLSQPVASDVNVKGGEAEVYTEPAYVRPSLHGRYLDYVDKGAAGPTLFRVDAATLAPPVAASVPGASRLLGPVAADTSTLLAKQLADSSLSLVAVAR